MKKQLPIDHSGEKCTSELLRTLQNERVLIR